MASRAAVILAAGQGTRMKSDLPKVLHEVGGRAMVDWSIALARDCGCERIVVVVSPAQAALRAHVEAQVGPGATAVQDPPLGTGHAVLAAKEALAGFAGAIVVLYGDTPFIPRSAVARLFEEISAGAGVGVLGFEAEAPGAYGRLIEDAGHTLEAIVEAKDATPEQLSVRLCNSGVMAAAAGDLFRLLGQVGNDNAKGEYYLTDVVALARAEGRRAVAVRCEEADTLGVNSRDQLAAAEAAFQAKKRAEAMAAGATLRAPLTVFFSFDTELGRDVEVEPNVVFGPGVRVADGARIRAFSHLEGADVGPGCVVGPYARLRPGTRLGADVRIGNFVETKNTAMGEGAKANHLAYLGDGSVGAGANIGAGVIFCNYDGFLKYQTRVGEGAFVGSNSALVAPVTIGDRAYVGSGSVVTQDVAEDALALARGRQREKPGWAVSFRARMAAEKANR